MSAGLRGRAFRHHAAKPQDATTRTETTIASTPIDLKAGDLRLAVRADLGGSIAGLWLGDLPVLRSTEPADLATSRLAGCYPLVPYSSRLGYRRFRWAGQDHRTLPNDGADNPHSLHGVAWQRLGRVSTAADSAELRYEHNRRRTLAVRLRTRHVLF